MRHPFYVDHLDSKDRKMVRRTHAGAITIYLSLLLLGMFAVKLHSPNIQVVAEANESVAGAPDDSASVNAFSVAAAERPDMVQCAKHDLRIVTSLADHGEAQDIPAEALNEAFLALVRARAACIAGRIDEALAIYGGIAVAPGQSARKSGDVLR